MTSIRCLLALMAAVGNAGLALGCEAGVDADLRAARLPGSETFNDLVVLDAAIELARESLAQHDNASARIATLLAIQAAAGRARRAASQLARPSKAR